MIDNIKDVFRIITEYMGSGFYVILYVAALVWLFITEKDKVRRLILCYLPLTLLLIYLCPVYYRVYVLKLDSHGTYYRNLWLLPMTVTVAYAFCKVIALPGLRLIGKKDGNEAAATNTDTANATAENTTAANTGASFSGVVFRVIAAAFVCGVLMICGKFSFGSSTSARAENLYHIPDYCIELCDLMEQDIPGVNVYACVPLEMLFYIRQYDPDINLVYGRDAAEPVWGYYNETYEAYELAEELDWEKVLKLTRDSSLGVGVVSYFVVPSDRNMSSDPELSGLEKIAESGNYILYLDTVARDQVREILKDTPYME
jgi:hypothetical protein